MHTIKVSLDLGLTMIWFKGCDCNNRLNGNSVSEWNGNDSFALHHCHVVPSAIELSSNESTFELVQMSSMTSCIVVSVGG